MSVPRGLDIREPGPFDGAGLLSSGEELGKALESGTSFDVAVASAKVALDVLGIVDDPLAALASTGMAWAIEHFAFLREGLDLLAGRPDEIRALAGSWAMVSEDLAGIAEDRLGTAAPGAGTGTSGFTRPAWQGMAGRAFGEATEAEAIAIATVAVKANDLAITLLTAGEWIGVVRTTVRNLIADFVGFVVRALLSGVATAVASAGTTIAILISKLVVDAIQVSHRITEQIEMLENRLADAGDLAGRIAGEMRSTSGDMQRIPAGPIDIDIDIDIRTSPTPGDTGNPTPGDTTAGAGEAAGTAR